MKKYELVHLILRSDNQLPHTFEVEGHMVHIIQDLIAETNYSIAVGNS